MPWEKRTVEQMREEFVKRVLAHECTKSALCKEYGISRPTGDKWIARYLSGDSMDDLRRTPKTQRNRISPEMENRIVKIRQQYPALGALKLHRMMENEGITNLPCPKTFNNVFHRHGLITAEASAAATAMQRYEKSRANEMWQADYKGNFLMKNGKRCHPLNIIDDYSRYNLCCEVQLTETFEEIQPIMIRLFKEYGMPFSILCDNGNPWGNAQLMGYTRFEVWLMELGVLTLHGRIYHPQTQGKGESYNRSFTRECLKNNVFIDEYSTQQIFSQYRDFYNNRRPHHALKLEVPGSRYRRSEIDYPERVQAWDYPKEYQVLHTSSKGYFTYKGTRYFLSDAFSDKTIAVRESHLPGQLTIVFRQFKIARIDLTKKTFTLRRAYLLNDDPRK